VFILLLAQSSPHALFIELRQSFETKPSLSFAAASSSCIYSFALLVALPARCLFYSQQHTDDYKSQ
jgi:hypothetical protein